VILNLTPQGYPGRAPERTNAPNPRGARVLGASDSTRRSSSTCSRRRRVFPSLRRRRGRLRQEGPVLCGLALR
jgi:hypothetical protein